MKMRITYLYLILFAILLNSCQKNLDVTETENGTISPELIETIEFEWWAIVVEENSLFQWNDISNVELSNVSVKLMFMDEVLWETNSDNSGRIEFPKQNVPAEGAYFLFESPGYHPLVVAIEGESIPLWQVNLVRDNYPGIPSEAITNAESYIVLTGILQDPMTARESWYYITNSSGELIGNGINGPELPSFYITTLPNEELFFHYVTECGSGVVPLGSFSESTEISSLLDQSFDFSFESDLIYLDNVNECGTNNKLFGYDLIYKRHELSYQWMGNSGFFMPDCSSTDQAILVSIATQNPRKYLEVEVDYIAGQQNDIPDQEACEDDDTYLEYTVGGNMLGGGQVFTFANTLPEGILTVKQIEHELINQNRFTMTIEGTELGTHDCAINVYVRQEFNSGGWSNINGFGGNQLTATITSNNGQFVEGTISGEVIDTEEVSLGNFEGVFKARIQ